MSNRSLDPIVLGPRPMVAPRSRSARPAQRSIPAKQIATAIVIATLLAVLVGRGGKIVLEPLMAMHRSGQDIRALESDLARRQANYERLQREKAYLSTPAGVEEEARRQGWVRQGETAIRVLRPEKPADPSPGNSHSSPARQQTAVERVRAFVDTALVPVRGTRAKNAGAGTALESSTPQ